MTTGLRVAVFGAGAFGGWTALSLVRRGARVTLVEPWGPGHARSSSGGETRVIRATYGSHAVYADMAVRALDLWRAHEAAWQRRFFVRTGVLWLFGPPDDGAFGRASMESLETRGVPVEALTAAEAARRWPQVSFEGLSTAMFEPGAGYLLARRACEHVLERFVAGGGTYRLGAADAPVHLMDSPVRRVRLTDGDTIGADVFVFACGPWLPSLFPDALAGLIAPTRQDVFYFGTPAGDDRFVEGRLPAWVDLRERLVYGIPGNAHRGFKIGDDTPGPAIDPTRASRAVDPGAIDAARAFLAERFPQLAGAPFIGSEVCQYESTPDSNFVLDRHPAAANVWIAGGGSGHGYKMGPALGELMTALVLDGSRPDPLFSLQRFTNPPTGGWQPKWS